MNNKIQKKIIYKVFLIESNYKVIRLLESPNKIKAINHLINKCKLLKTKAAM